MEVEVSRHNEDRRSLERKERSKTRFWHPTPGRIVDACAAGMAVQTRLQLEVGRTYTFKTRHGSHSLQIPAIVKWSRLELSPTSGSTGTASQQLASYRSGVFFPDSLDSQAAEFLLGSDQELTLQ